MSSDQRKQLMTKGFLYSTVVLVLATCGIVPATAQFPPPPAHFQRHRRKLSPSPVEGRASQTPFSSRAPDIPDPAYASHR
jgi:hypothetical protein